MKGLEHIDSHESRETSRDVENLPVIAAQGHKLRLAHRALELEPDVGLLLPCNVVVRTHEGRTVVSAVDPGIIAEMADHPGLKPISEEATSLLDAALESLTA